MGRGILLRTITSLRRYCSVNISQDGRIAAHIAPEKSDVVQISSTKQPSCNFSKWLKGHGSYLIIHSVINYINPPPHEELKNSFIYSAPPPAGGTIELPHITWELLERIENNPRKECADEFSFSTLHLNSFEKYLSTYHPYGRSCTRERVSGYLF